MSFELSDIAFFRQHAEAIAAVDLPLTKKSQLADAAALRERFGERGRAVAELLSARRSGKLPVEWLMDGDSAQQATPPAVAARRAEFLRDAGAALVQDVTCSIGTELVALAGAGVEAIGSDLDPVRLAMAGYNLGVEGHRQALLRADALTATTTADVIVADPARRAGGRRITDPAQLLPPLPDLLAAHPGKEMAVKCAPGIDYSEWVGLVTVTSLDGGVKEACLYTPGLGRGRTAVMLCSDGRSDSISGGLGDEGDLPEAGQPGRYVIDPDGAVVRAGLVRHYAAREGLWQLDPRIAYLTGDRIPAGASGFEIVDVVPVKKLKAALAARDAGSAEILVRGLDVDPDQLRKKLKLRGSRAVAVVLTRIGSQGFALVCNPRVDSAEG